MIGDPARFVGKTLLDLGCRTGKMAAYFASLGARVDGFDINAGSVRQAEMEADRWRVTANFCVFSGALEDLPSCRYDFIFTKSVLVLFPDLDSALAQISRVLKPEGQYIAVENLRGGPFIAALRTLTGRGKNYRFQLLDRDFRLLFMNYFRSIEAVTRFNLVAGVKAARPLQRHPNREPSASGAVRGVP